MMRYNRKAILGIALSLLCSLSFGQEKQEREHRIRKSQFPASALEFIAAYVDGAKRLKFYKEIDKEQIDYTAKFKKGRLHYNLKFDTSGALELAAFRVKEVDFPEDSWSRVTSYLKTTYTKCKIKKMWQQYPVTDHAETKIVLKNTFQNLMIPAMNYKLFVKGKKEKGFIPYEILFDDEGNFKSSKKALPANYDHVLY